MHFTNMKQAVNHQFNKMIATGALFVVSLDKYALWDLYLESFPEGTNPIFRERTEHDCNCCKQFIRHAGNVVAFVDGELTTIWDIEVGGYYQVVADALSAFVKAHVVDTIFLTDSYKIGTDQSLELSDDGEIVWNHFYQEVPSEFVKPKADIASLKGKARNNYQVLERSIREISEEAVADVLDLIEQKQLYRGNEHVRKVKQLRELQRGFAKADNIEEFLWEQSLKLGESSAFRNTVIGTLLVDISDGKDLEQAVKSFETKVAPANYKRSSSLVTQAMKDRAVERAQELGIEDSLPRRQAQLQDITVNNVLFADRSAKKIMGALDVLKPNAPVEHKGNATEISIDDFIADVVPKTDAMELLLDNDFQQNFMTLVAPVNPNARGIMKWNNNFSWAYDGDVTDSGIKQNVQKAGGNTTGVLRFSIQWNTPDRPHMSDLDAWCRTPKVNIGFSNKRPSIFRNTATLDVDIQTPKGVAVENIIFTDLSKMPDGDYQFYVNNYTKRSGEGFTAEIEFAGQTLEFNHIGPVRVDVNVATINKKGNTLTLKKSMEHKASVQQKWGLTTQQFVKVDAMMLSPNHWDGQSIGNKHTFFILDGCKNPDPVRGFYNEFLIGELHDDRKVFEHLGSLLKAPYAEEQMSGVGFSETIRNQVIVKCDGRKYKVKF